MGMLTQSSMQGYNPTLAHGNYNGTVDVNGKKVQVANGTAMFDGQSYVVSDDGKLVLASNGIPVGYIESGKFKQITEDYATRLKQSIG